MTGKTNDCEPKSFRVMRVKCVFDELWNFGAQLLAAAYLSCAISLRSVLDPKCTRFLPSKVRLARIKATPNTKTLLLSSQFIHTACLNNLRGQAHTAYNWRIIRIALWLAVLWPPFTTSNYWLFVPLSSPVAKYWEDVCVLAERTEDLRLPYGGYGL
jgi:hypothetical protein